SARATSQPAETARRTSELNSLHADRVCGPAAPLLSLSLHFYAARNWQSTGLPQCPAAGNLWSRARRQKNRVKRFDKAMPWALCLGLASASPMLSGEEAEALDLRLEASVTYDNNIARSRGA